MNGHVDHRGRALIEVRLISPPNDSTPLEVWIDTGFTGQLVVPREEIDRLGLRKASGTHARLADGSTAFLETFEATLDWFGEQIAIEVIEGQGAFPLLGVIPMLGYTLIIDYGNQTVSIERTTPATG